MRVATATISPNSIDIAKVMDTLRSISNRTGKATGEKDISMFHNFFLILDPRSFFI